MSEVQSEPRAVSEKSTTVVESEVASEGEVGSGNFVGGLIGGLVAAAIGAVAWAAITVTTQFQIGWMAVGVGVVVGFAVRKFGNGAESRYRILGGALALVGCVAGNLLSAIAFVAQSQSIPFFAALARLPMAALPELYAATFDVMDLLFYGIAIYEGYKLAVRPANAS